MMVMDVELRVADMPYNLPIPVCPQHHRSNVQVVSIKGLAGTLPSHHPIEMAEAPRFPPNKGELFLKARPGIVVGCPGCGKMVSLHDKIFSMDAGQLKPSFICPFCSLHAFLHLAGSNPPSGA